MIKLKEEKGAITILALVTMLFFISFLVVTYIFISNKAQTEMEATKRIRAIYESDVSEEIFNSYFEGGRISGVLLPSDYQQVEYIENKDGAYIDTGIPATRILGIDLKVLYTGTEEAAFVGSYQMYQGILMGYSSGGFGMATNCSWKYVGVQSDNDWHEFTYRDDEGYFENKSFGLPEMKNYNNNIYLFSANSFGKNKAGVRIAICRIYKDGALVREFIPCYCTKTVTNVNDTSCPANTPGLYDIVEGEFYTNNGDGDFEIGEKIENHKPFIVPIYTPEQLQKIGSDEYVKINEVGGKYYYFSPYATYVLMNSFTFESETFDIGIIKEVDFNWNNNKIIFNGKTYTSGFDDYKDIIENLKR